MQTPDINLPDDACEKMVDLAGDLTCLYCNEFYEDPEMLPCLHVVCTKCIKKLQRSRLKIRKDVEGVVCPICRRFCHSSEIKTDKFLKRLVQEYTQKQNPPICCEGCKARPSDDNGRCQSCEVTIGNFCTKKKNDARIQSDQAVHFRKSEEELQVCLTLQNFCARHKDSTASLYCEHCEEAFCTMCTDHQHELVHIKEQIELKKKLLRDFGETFGDRQKHLRMLKQDIEKLQKGSWESLEQFRCRLLVNDSADQDSKTVEKLTRYYTDQKLFLKNIMETIETHALPAIDRSLNEIRQIIVWIRLIETCLPEDIRLIIVTDRYIRPQAQYQQNGWMSAEFTKLLTIIDLLKFIREIIDDRDYRRVLSDIVSGDILTKQLERSANDIFQRVGLSRKRSFFEANPSYFGKQCIISEDDIEPIECDTDDTFISQEKYSAEEPDDDVKNSELINIKQKIKPYLEKYLQFSALYLNVLKRKVIVELSSDAAVENVTGELKNILDPKTEYLFIEVFVGDNQADELCNEGLHRIESGSRLIPVDEHTHSSLTQEGNDHLRYELLQKPCGTATCFAEDNAGKLYLITSMHLLTTNYGIYSPLNQPVITYLAKHEHHGRQFQLISRNVYGILGPHQVEGKTVSVDIAALPLEDNVDINDVCKHVTNAANQNVQLQTVSANDLNGLGRTVQKWGANSRLTKGILSDMDCYHKEGSELCERRIIVLDFPREVDVSSCASSVPEEFAIKADSGSLVTEELNRQKVTTSYGLFVSKNRHKYNVMNLYYGLQALQEYCNLTLQLL